ncbi:phage integrase SAM-like domain-containing protein [uncultured Mesonia sp.]|uniref:phage integrase SAM-like domain-containing protein n=1 Tax=uncultured Mesonia sp. TaxID=399731 RepID=UPI00374EC154
MASINFSYRSKKEIAYIELRLAYTVDGKRKFQHARTKIQITKKFWDEIKTKGNRFRDTEKIIEYNKINEHLSQLETVIYQQLPPDAKIEMNWLKDAVKKYYNPNDENKIPTDLLEYWDYYMNLREYELKQKPRSWQKWNEIKNRVHLFQKKKKRKYSIEDINEEFKRDWIKYCKEESYANTTIKKNLSYIKMLCQHAARKGLKTSSDLVKLNANFKKEDLPRIYLSFEELEKIKALKSLPDYLDNARDWLVISCFTGQRVSDFMRFNSSMIRKSKGRKFIDVTQRKTEKKVSIPILPEVESILKKRKGEFPRTISAQKYNTYIKEIGKLANINKPTKGKILKKLEDGKNRKVLDIYPKHKLITSHIGRRSLATNYYGVIPSSYLKNITGHGTEAMLLAYIGKTSKDTAFEAYDLMLAHNKRNVKLQ